MGWGILYEVSDSVSLLLHTCKKKIEWYEAMGTLSLKDAPQLDAEDSIRFWASKLQSINHPTAKFFNGDAHAEYDETSDPNVCLVGRESVLLFLSQIELLGKQFFVDLFPNDGPYGVGKSWLYDPLCTFLRGVCSRDGAVLVLWEN